MKAALEILLEAKIEPEIEQVNNLLNSGPKITHSVHIDQPVLSEYDALHNFKSREAA